MAGAGNYGGQNLNADQVNNAATIARVGQQMGASARDIQIALAAAMTESSLVNLHSGDRDSQGLFQQRPSQGWGSVAQVTDPVHASQSFFNALFKVPNRDSLAPQLAAQAVQRSAFSNGSNYAKYVNLGQALQQAIGGGAGAPPGAPGGPPLGPDMGGTTSNGIVTGGNIAGDTGNILSQAQEPGTAGGQSWWDWLTGAIPGMDGLQAVATSIGGASSALGDIAKPFLWLSSSKHWVRIFAGAAGAVFLFMGMSMIAREVKNG